VATTRALRIGRRSKQSMRLCRFQYSPTETSYTTLTSNVVWKQREQTQSCLLRGNLYNPTLFALYSSTPTSYAFPFDGGLHLPHADLALEYLEIVQGLKTRTPMSAVKGHMFKLMRPGLAKEIDLRNALTKVKSGGLLDGYVEIAKEMKRRMDRDAKNAEGKTSEGLLRVDPGTGLKVLPHWLAQPYWRP